jgi:hypothetical protein
MFKIPRRTPWPPQLDLSSVRRTLVPLQSDLARVPALVNAAAALGTAIAEIDAAERATNAARLHDSTVRRLTLVTRRH